MDVILNNLEYLALKIDANPGLTAREYLRALSLYRRGYEGTGNWGASYFTPRGRYRGKLWKDAAPQTRVRFDWTGRVTYGSKKGEWVLTLGGQSYANDARKKLGLPIKKY